MNLLIYFHNYPILNKYIIISKGLQWALSEAILAISSSTSCFALK